MHRNAKPQRACAGRRALATGLALFVCAVAAPASAQQAGGEALVPCPSTVSLEGRLVMQQWAPRGGCDKPVRTRVTDRFLGFSCVEANAGASVCRAYAPPPGSRQLDTSQVFRCVDLVVMPTEMGTVLTRMREWVGPSSACDWTYARDLLTMEVDFARGEVCSGNLCISAARLTAIGQLRLRHLIEKALRDLDLASWTASVPSPAAAPAR